jgi:glutamate-1-semialdehyde 2,1-aminomutase
MTAAVYGHSQPIIQNAITATMHTYGLNLGATTKLESQYASLICSRFGIDRVRFCNSGTEANLHALAGARKFTGKRKVVVFANGYHGAVFTFSGGKVVENNVDHDDWIIVPYNDIDATVAAIQSEGVAAVIVEGMQGAGGAIPGTLEFLKAIEKTAKESGVVFIMDEVMTSRSSPGGLAALHHLKPDLKTFGKYLGSGLAFGAFGGREEVMRVYDPREPGSLSHSGTFNNNTLAMGAGYVGLSQVFTPEACTEFNELGNYMREQLNEASKGTKLSYTGVGGILCSHVTIDGRTTVLRTEDGKDNADLDIKDLMWMEMMEEGFWISRRGSLALILGMPKDEIDRYVTAYQRFLEKYYELVRIS